MNVSQTVSELWSGHEYMVKMVQCSKGNNSKRWLTRVMVHVFCTSSHGALH